MRAKFKLPKGMSKAIADELGVSRVSVYNALWGKNDSALSKKIRQTAHQKTIDYKNAQAEGRTIIMMLPEDKAQLAKDMEVSMSTVRNALAGRTVSTLTTQIRYTALERGGAHLRKMSNNFLNNYKQ